MKTFVTALFVTLALVVGVQAQSARPFNVYVGGGFSPLSGDYGDGWNTGFHLSVGMGSPIAPSLQIVPKIEYHSFSLDDHGLPVSGGTLSSFMFGGDLQYNFGLPTASVRPLILGGVGFARSSVSDMTVDGETFAGDSETKLYLDLGGGLEFKAGQKLNLFTTLRYVSVSTSGSSLGYFPFTFGVRF